MLICKNVSAEVCSGAEYAINTFFCTFVMKAVICRWTYRKKRYAHLVNWKRRKFHNYTQEWHSGSHAYSVGCYYYIRV